MRNSPNQPQASSKNERWSAARQRTPDAPHRESGNQQDGSYQQGYPSEQLDQQSDYHQQEYLSEQLDQQGGYYHQDIPTQDIIDIFLQSTLADAYARQDNLTQCDKIQFLL